MKSCRCNVCGNKISKNDYAEFNITYTYGYNSDYDQNYLDLNVCESCLNELTKQIISVCKINPLREI